MHRLWIVLVLARGIAVAEPPGSWSLEAGASIDAARGMDAEDSGALGGSVGISHQIEHAGCKTLDMTQRAQWYWRDAERGVAMTGATEMCVDLVDVPAEPGEPKFPPILILGGYDLRTAARPRLDAPRTLRVDDYSLYGAHFDLGLVERRHASHQISAVRLGMRADVTLQGPGAELATPTQSLLSADFIGLIYRGGPARERGLVLEAARVAFRFEANHGTSLLGVTPVSIAGWRRGALILGAHAGYTYGHMRARTMHIVTGGARLDTKLAGTTLGLRYGREVLPAVDPIVIIEDRLTAEASHPLLGGTLAASGFAALSLAVSVSGAMNTRDLTGGGSLSFTRSFSRYLAWHVAFEAGRSFYARFEAGMPEVGSVVRVRTGLEIRFGR